MEFRTIVDIPKLAFQIEPCEEILLVGSCFADSIGQRFKDEKFHATVNPFGVMYNPLLYPSYHRAVPGVPPYRLPDVRYQSCLSSERDR